MRHALTLGGLLSFGIALFHVVLAFSVALRKQFNVADWVADVRPAPPYAVTMAGLALLYVLCGLCALSGAGWFKPWPLLRLALLTIGMGYAWRGVRLIPELAMGLGLLHGTVSAHALACSLVAAAAAACYLGGPVSVLARTKDWYGK